MYRKKLWIIGGLLLFIGLGIRPFTIHALGEVVGDGSSASCTESAFDTALATVEGNGGGTITFDCGGDFTFQFNDEKAISAANIVIDGGDEITIDGRNFFRLFTIANDSELTLENITLIRGYNNSVGGGAILNHGNLNLQNSTIRDSNVDPSVSGGAILSYGPVTINNSLIENNSGGSVGGLFLLGETADAMITNSTFRSNFTTNPSYGLGGAITIWDGADVTLHQSVIELNAALYGGGIYNSSAGGIILVEQNTLFRENSALGGGAIFGSDGEIIINNSILQANIANDDGGGIASQTTVTITNSTLQDNNGRAGGAIYNSLGQVNLDNTILLNNIATEREGGGIANKSSGVVIVTNSRLENNKALDPNFGYGGGIANSSGDITLIHSTVINNSTVTDGGGIYNGDNATLINSILQNNSANNGGGIDNWGAATLTNMTLIQNSADKGGGMRNSGIATLRHVTFSNNITSQFGSELYHSTDSSSETITVENVIFDNFGNYENCIVPFSSHTSITSLGANLSTDATCFLDHVDDFVDTPAWLGILKDNGGFTQTRLQLPNSPTVDNGHCITGVLEDQREIPRPQDSACDIGAAEWIPLNLIIALLSDDTAQLDWNDTIHDSYQLWLSITPYAGYSPFANHADSQTDVAVNPVQNYFYAVYGIFGANAAEQSNRVGVFSYAITSGS